MNIEDNIKIQQAFVQARIEYAAAEEKSAGDIIDLMVQNH